MISIKSLTNSVGKALIISSSNFCLSDRRPFSIQRPSNKIFCLLNCKTILHFSDMPGLLKLSQKSLKNLCFFFLLVYKDTSHTSHFSRWKLLFQQKLFYKTATAPSKFEQVFFPRNCYRNFIQVAKSATGKMYKRGTFGNILSSTPKSFRGLLWQRVKRNIGHCEKDNWWKRPRRSVLNSLLSG